MKGPQIHPTLFAYGSVDGNSLILTTPKIHLQIWLPEGCSVGVEKPTKPTSFLCHSNPFMSIDFLTAYVYSVSHWMSFWRIKSFSVNSLCSLPSSLSFFLSDVFLVSYCDSVHCIGSQIHQVLPLWLKQYKMSDNLSTEIIAYPDMFHLLLP